MKDILKSFAAMLLVIWYSLSIIGFDVHTCSGSGETYIATIASGLSCEDIHPEHGHTGCRCCHPVDTENGSIDRKPCCTDDYQVILLTGIRSTDESGTSYDHGPLQLASHSDACADNLRSEIYLSALRAFYKPRSECMLPRDVQANYSIWRI